MDSDPTRPTARLAIPILGAVLAVVLLAAEVGRAAPSPDPALPLTLTDPVAGRPVELHPGAPVLHLVFFATWCPPCRDELPRLTQLDTRWGDAGYRLVLVAVPARQSVERLRDFLESSGAEGEFLFDATGSAQAAFRADRLPTHVLLDARGAVVLRTPSLDAEVESMIETMMVEHARGSGR